jgi:hypothetical protein
MQRLGLAMFLVWAAACGPVSSRDARQAPMMTRGTPDPQAANEVPENGIECANEVPTGTYFEHKVCRTPEEKAMDRRKVEELLVNPIGYPHRY